MHVADPARPLAIADDAVEPQIEGRVSAIGIDYLHNDPLAFDAAQFDQGILAEMPGQLALAGRVEWLAEARRDHRYREREFWIGYTEEARLAVIQVISEMTRLKTQGGADFHCRHPQHNTAQRS